MTSRLSKALAAGLCIGLLNCQVLFANCQFFRFPQQDSEQMGKKRSCRPEIVNFDLDKDGIPDWRTPLPGSHFYFPADEDLDGDRIHNLLDPDPFTANQITRRPCPNCLPQHALRYNDRKTQDLQRTLLAETGIYSMAYGRSLTPSILEAMLRMTRGSAHLMHAAAPRLRFLLASETPLARDAQALYLEPIDAILISPHLATQSPAEQIRTLAHELGHALIFARFTPASFAAFAHQLGDWPQAYPDNFYAPTLLTRFSGTVTRPEIFPNAYSFANPHEWFAENIAELVMKSLDLPHRANQGFANALYRQLNQRLVSH